ncbi:MAG: Serine hydroxymethyltransferase [Chlamydiae bacterium]|nr:Serine hydroxymethyltransferase [Chlamydiota bacterium]
MTDSLLDKYLEKNSGKPRKKEVIAYLAILDHLQERAPYIAKPLLQELVDQKRRLKLIASENYSSLTVQLAMGNLLTDKYCEGFPYHRFYAGCENVDQVESEAVEGAKALFGASHAYVQPHSGADANLVAFWAILTKKIQNKEIERLGKKSPNALTNEEFEKLRQLLCNQTFLGLSLHSGGHLTHGFRQNVSAKMMRAVSYSVDPDTGLLDYGEIARIAREEKPLILLAGYSAYPRRINFAKMREIADEVGAVLLCDMAHFAGLVAGKVFQGEEDPVPYAHIITSTTHKTLRGPRGGLILCQPEFSEVIDKGCPLVLGGPLPHVIGAKAIAFREANTPDFQDYAGQVVTNARALATSLKREGISVVTNGTDNHLVLLDLSHLGITGKIGENALVQAEMIVNRNMIPFDSEGAWFTSGIRIGTAALTTRGMKEKEMEMIGKWISRVLHNTRAGLDPKTGEKSRAHGETDPKILEEVREGVASLLKQYPLYPELEI